MSYQKIATLVKQICEKSNNGTIEWEATEKEGVYQVSFSNYSIRLYPVASQEHPGDYDYVIEIINSDGELVEKTNDIDLHPWWENSYTDMKHTHETARRKVMGVEDALDSIFDELNKVDDEKTPF